MTRIPREATTEPAYPEQPCDECGGRGDVDDPWFGFRPCPSCPPFEEGTNA